MNHFSGLKTGIRQLYGICRSRMQRAGYYLLLAGMFLGLSGCTRNRSRDEGHEIIAKAGDLRITAKEFKYNFEFSLASLRRGPDARRTFLNLLIHEKLLAAEGYRIGLNQSPYVARRMKQRRYLNLLEAFYQKYVHERVHITEDQIQDALKKGTVTWRMRIWPVPSLEEAQAALIRARSAGFSEYIQEQLSKRDIPVLEEEYFTTEWIDFLDMNPEILDGIKDLEINEISEPIPFDDGYALFQVTDIHREGIKEEELFYGVKRKKMMDRLHNIQADSISHVLMDSVLTPMDIRVKGHVVQDLAPLLFQWIQDRLPSGMSLSEAIENADSTRPYLKEIRKMSGETLITYSGGKKTVGDYIDYMDYYRRNLKQARSQEEFEKRLLTEIGRMMRNDTYIAIGQEEGFADSVGIRIQEDLRLWEEKWTYDAYRDRLVKEKSVSEDELREWFAHHWRELDLADVDSTRFESYRIEVHSEVLHRKQMAVIDEELKRLEKKYTVWIDEKKLDRIELLDDPGTNHISFFVMNRFSNKPVVPTVDMKWIAF